MKTEYKNNPIAFSNERTRALDEACEALIASVNVLAENNKL